MGSKAIQPRWIVALTGASGAPYARRLLGVMAEQDLELHVIASGAGIRVWEEEIGEYGPTDAPLWLQELPEEGRARVHLHDVGAAPPGAQARLFLRILLRDGLRTQHVAKRQGHALERGPQVRYTP